MAPPTNALDHIIHLSPPGKLSEAVGHWEKLGFKVVPGGQHADGLTSNALVALADGIYIELIAFEKPANEYPPDSPRSKHWWANKEPGWIDWACLGLEDHVDQTIAARDREVRSGVQYQEGKIGGRTRAGDGQELKWRVTFPELKHGRGTVPFFCQDLTPRELRVPSANVDTHDNTALGISHLHISVPKGKLEDLKSQLSVVLGTLPNDLDEWELTLPPTMANVTPATLRVKLIPSGSNDSKIVEVGFYVEKDGHKDIGTPDGFGKVVFVRPS